MQFVFSCLHSSPSLFLPRVRRRPPPHRAAHLNSRHNREHFSRITGSAVIRILPWPRRTTSRILVVACFLSQPARAGRLLPARLTRAISSADISSFSRWAALPRGIFFYSSNRNYTLEEPSPRSPTRHPWSRLLTIVRLVLVFNFRRTSTCPRHNIS